MLNTKCAIFMAAVAGLIINDSAFAQQEMRTTNIGHMPQDLNRANGTRLRFLRSLTFPEGARELCIDAGNIIDCASPTPTTCRLELKYPSTSGPYVAAAGSEIQFPELGTCEERGGDMLVHPINDPNASLFIAVARMTCGSIIRPSVATAYTARIDHKQNSVRLFTSRSEAQLYCDAIAQRREPGARVSTCGPTPTGRRDDSGNALYDIKFAAASEAGAQWSFGPESPFESLGCYNGTPEAVQRAFLTIADIGNVAGSAAAPAAEAINNAPPSKGLQNSSKPRNKASSAH